MLFFVDPFVDPYLLIANIVDMLSHDIVCLAARLKLDFSITFYTLGLVVDWHDHVDHLTESRDVIRDVLLFRLHRQALYKYRV